MLQVKYPHIGATPDGYVTCKCCGFGVLEIKCPASFRAEPLAAMISRRSFCLKNQDGDFILQRNHQYFYQVQAQMFICQANYCDFVVWGIAEMALINVKPDKSFMEDVMTRVSTFHRLCVMPELVGKYFSKQFTCLPDPAASAMLSQSETPAT